ncbi:unnamed protein product [Gordionus sp. m RMFG-2023]
MNLKTLFYVSFLTISLSHIVLSFVDYYSTAPYSTPGPPSPATQIYSTKIKGTKFNHHDFEAYVDKVAKKLVKMLQGVKILLKHNKDKRSIRINPIDVVLAIDASGAMGLDKFECAKYFAKV